MIENVYVVPPSSSVNRRVHTTSAPSAVMPESAMAAYTRPVPAGASTLAGVAVATSPAFAA